MNKPTKEEKCLCGGMITGDAEHSIEHCKANNTYPSIKELAEQSIEGWEREFDEKFPQLYTGYPVGTFGERIKNFIRKTVKEAREEGWAQALAYCVENDLIRPEKFVPFSKIREKYKNK